MKTIPSKTFPTRNLSGLSGAAKASQNNKDSLLIGTGLKR